VALIGNLLFLLALIVLMPAMLLTLQVLAAMPAHRPRAMPSGRRPTVAILVPAHNESLLIADTLKTIMPQLATGDRLLVVADNCSDNTAGIALAAGAAVIERINRDRRGKIHALEFGVRHLAKNPPECLLIIDADCVIESGAVERLARRCLETGRPVQGLYQMRSPVGAPLKIRIAEFAWLVKNQVRALGAARLGMPCQLMGSGMIFPWRCISAVSLDGGYLSEDYKLGLDLARAGTPALFCPEARVASYFPSSADGISSQRTRWEHGHISLILGNALSLLVESIVSANLPVAGLALDLCVPPLALLMLLAGTIFLACAAYYFAAGSWMPLCVAIWALSLLALSVLLSWARFARHVVALQSLVYAPVYALQKIPLYMRFLVRRQVEWVRSRRDGE
jgi:cellulose synthase/poly-beta-1,6-N-acetylglucosamine synthase-like glycosyltransferase